MTNLNNVKYCGRCKKIFTDLVGRKICPECKKEIDEILEEVKKYIKENNAVKMKEISIKFEIPMNQILQWIREGELELTKDSDIQIFCKKCEKQIYSGMYCDSCKSKMVDNFNSVTKKNTTIIPEIKTDKRDKDKMRFLSNQLK